MKIPMEVWKFPSARAGSPGYATPLRVCSGDGLQSEARGLGPRGSMSGPMEEGQGPSGGAGGDAAFAPELARCAHRYLQVEGRGPARGRGLVASKRIARGEDVLAEEPYAAVLFSEEVSRFCDFTFKPNQKLLRCAKSKVSCSDLGVSREAEGDV